MKFYSSYWIWRWDLCLSHSCSLAFYCTATVVLWRAHTYTVHAMHSTVWSPACTVGIIFLLIVASCGVPSLGWSVNSFTGNYCILFLFLLLRIMLPIKSGVKLCLFILANGEKHNGHCRLPKKMNRSGKLEPELVSALAADGMQQ